MARRSEKCAVIGRSSRQRRGKGYSFTYYHRFDEAPGQRANFYVIANSQEDPPIGPVVYTLRVYHSTVLKVYALDLSLVDRAIADRYRAVLCAAGPATPVYRNPYPNVECHPNPLPLPRHFGLRLEGCSFDVRNDLLYAINQFSDRAFAYRDGIYLSDYDVPFPDRSVTGLASPRWQGATFLPAKYDHAMLLLANRDGSVWGFSDLSEDRIARGEPARIRDPKYDLSGAQIDADVRTGQFVAAGITYDTVRDRLYLSTDGNAAAFMRNPPNTAWVRDAASDVDGAGGSGLTFDGLSLLSAQKAVGVSAWTEGAASPGVSIPPEELQRLAGNVLVYAAWRGTARTCTCATGTTIPSGPCRRRGSGSESAAGRRQPFGPPHGYIGAGASISPARALADMPWAPAAIMVAHVRGGGQRRR